MEAVAAFLFVLVLVLGTMVFLQYQSIRLYQKQQHHSETESTASYTNSYFRPISKKKEDH